MGFFYERSETTEKGKLYLVLKSKPSFCNFAKYFGIFLFMLLVLLVVLDMFHSLNNISSSVFIKGAIILIMVFIILIVSFIWLEYMNVVNSAVGSGRTVIIKGGTIYSHENPREIWIEKATGKTDFGKFVDKIEEKLLKKNANKNSINKDNANKNNVREGNAISIQVK
jgi:hypothetical protein